MPPTNQSSMAIVKEFREFISKGNVIDLAVGVIIGAAFGKIVSSLVTDVIMPPIGLLMGKMDFSDRFIPLNGKAYETLKLAKEESAPLIAYGSFLNTCIEFLIVAFCVFLLVKGVNTLRRAEEKKAPAPTKTEVLLAEIRDSLKKN